MAVVVADAMMEKCDGDGDIDLYYRPFYVVVSRKAGFWFDFPQISSLNLGRKNVGLNTFSYMSMYKKLLLSNKFLQMLCKSNLQNPSVRIHGRHVRID